MIPSFYLRNLKKHMETFNKNAIAMAEKLAVHLDNEEFDLGSYISETTMNTFLGKAFSYPLNLWC